MKMTNSKQRKCPQCEAEVSASAKKCKHCGSKLPLQMTKVRLISTIIIILFIVVSCSRVMDDYEPAPVDEAKKAEENRVNVAALCAQGKVESMLRSPSSAKFPWNLDATKLEDGSYMVMNYVDSQNGFGAMIRTNYLCTVKIIDIDNYRCTTECIFE